MEPVRIKALQIRHSDRVVVFEFEFSDGTKGSRGITLTDAEYNELLQMSFFEIIQLLRGVEYTKVTKLKSVIDRAIQEYLAAKAAEEEEKANTISGESFGL